MGCRGCGNASSCGCSLTGSDSVAFSGAGSSSDPFVGAVIIDPLSDNALELTSSGLYVSGGLGLIEESTLELDAASFTFSGIDQTFSSLLAIVKARGTAAATSIDLNMRFNGDTGTNYDWIRMSNTGAVIAAGEGLAASSIAIGLITGATAVASEAGMVEILIPDYARTTFRKGSLQKNALLNTEASLGMGHREGGGFWESTAAITSITFLPASGNLLAGSRFALYGLRGSG